MTHLGKPSVTPDFLAWLTSIRRDIHQHPETAFDEHRTSNLVAEMLESWGLIVHRGLAKTGLVATLEGLRGPGRTIGLRADLDALFIQEENDFAHRSCNEGKMHACGHDGHTAMLLGAARLLCANPDFHGKVRFIFQPAEEGLGGGRVMIEEGLFEKFPCDAVYAVHNAPSIPTGFFAIRSGPLLAAGDSWEIRFSGDGGHGAMPHMGTDPTMALTNFMSNLSTIVARNVPASESAVVSIGCVEGGDPKQHNIIPKSLFICGTARSYSPETRDILEKRLGELATLSAAAHNCVADFTYIRRYPPLINHKRETGIAAEAARRVAGADMVDDDIAPAGGSEDFAFMLEACPGAYMLIGNGMGPFVHTANYDFNDEILSTGVKYWLSLVDVELEGRML